MTEPNDGFNATLKAVRRPTGWKLTCIFEDQQTAMEIDDVELLSNPLELVAWVMNLPQAFGMHFIDRAGEVRVVR